MPAVTFSPGRIDWVGYDWSFRAEIERRCDARRYFARRRWRAVRFTRINGQCRWTVWIEE
jgi:hypothetical protein